MSIASSVEAPGSPQAPAALHSPPPPPTLVAGVLQAAPVALTALILLLVAWSQGAFALRYWGPLAVFALVALAAGGSTRRVDRWALAAVAALWAFAAWSLLSALWADSVARALEGGARNALYATLFALPVALVGDRRVACRLAAVLVAGTAVTALATYSLALADGPRLFLAGRLDDPVGYRNGTAALFVLTFWPLVCVAAVRRVHPLVRGAAFGVAVLALGLAFLTQSRGMLLGFVAGGIVAVTLGPDRVRRCWLALAAVGFVAAASPALLTPYDAFLDVRRVAEGDIATATRGLGTAALVGAVVALCLALLDGGIRLSEAAMRTAGRVAAGGLVVVAVIGAVGVLTLVGDPVGFAADKVREFQTEETAPGATRLGSTGGQRSDLWRVAIDEFRTAPVAGLGQGNYVTQYYERRSNDRNLTDAHSLALTTFAELGVVGALLLLAFPAALAIALLRRLRHLPPGARRWTSALAAGGTVVLAQASVDWLWLLPGVTGLAFLLLGVATAVASARPEAEPAREGPVRRVLVAAAPLLCAVLVAVLFLSDFHVRKARAAGMTSPEGQLASARTAERLNPFALTPHYLESGALESLGRAGDARRELLEALAAEPRNFVTMTLLGDLELRAGRADAARVWYRRALVRNPLDVGLQQLARG